MDAAEAVSGGEGWGGAGECGRWASALGEPMGLRGGRAREASPADMALG